MASSGEVVRQWTAAVMAGGLGLEFIDEAMVMENTPNFPITGPYHGHEGVRRWWGDLTEAFEEMRIELDEIVEVDDETAYTTQRIVGRFRATGIEIDEPWAAAYWVRNGRIVRTAGFGSGRSARRALGLPDR